ncbi:MAG: type II toxin-antitoxin system PemK/MazF family toxin [Verrucomicrobia bacterium]|nr:type II toxin-antitoxin system PemK/MazF family toxin [Verrucomicrobiota bacterium]
MVDLGLAAKVRPCLILSDYPTDDELALIVIVPHTTSLRGNRWEFPVSAPFLKTGAFHLQQIQPVSLVRVERKLGVLPPQKFADLRREIIRQLALDEYGQ